MKKVFISQPMGGLSTNEIMAVRRSAIGKVREMCNERIEIIDAYFTAFNASEMNPLKVLGESIILLADADIAYFVKGWEKARGCRIEHECAINYGIEVLEEA